jgi:hypothetical protein
MQTTPNKDSLKPPIRAVTMEVFPTMDSLRDVVELGYTKLPLTDRNELYSLLITYHNTLLHTLQRS